MTKYFAFLRAINVGGHNVKMVLLRQLFEALGVSNVETYIASGNVVFETSREDAKSLEAEIESMLQSSLGFEVATFLRTEAELNALEAYQPFPPADIEAATALNIAFLAEPLDDDAVQKLMALKTDIDEFHVHGREIYWLCQKKQSESTFSNAILERTIGRPSTLRGINTIKKMVTKYFSK